MFKTPHYKSHRIAACLFAVAFPYNSTLPAEELTLAEIQSLLVAGVSEVDILRESSTRGIDFVVGDKAINAMEAEGASRHFTVRIGLYASPIIKEFNIAKEHLAGRRYDRAIDIFSGIIRQSPRLVPAFRLRATAHFQAESFDAAIDDCQSILRLEPEDVSAVLARGRAWQGSGQYEAAIEDFTALIDGTLASASVKAGAWIHRADTLEQAGDSADAIDDLTEMLKRFPRHSSAQSRLAILLSTVAAPELRDTNAALVLSETALEAALPKTNDAARAYFAHALALLGNGDAAAARDEMAKAVALVENDERLSNRMSELRQFVIAGSPIVAGSVGSQTPDFDLFETLASEMVKVDGGNFNLGSNRNPEERPVHNVEIPQFWMLRHEVTEQMWASVMQTDFEFPNRPKTGVTWTQCEEFNDKLTQLYATEGLRFRLPTEAEWEFAAKAGKKDDFDFWFGNESGELSSHGWFKGNSAAQLHDVKTREANPLGIFDLYGNAAEWCKDSYVDYAEKKSLEESFEDTFKVVRGGSFLNSASMCRSAARGPAPRSMSRKGLGFRMVVDRELPTEPVVWDSNPTETPQGFDRLISELTEASRNGDGSVRVALSQLHYLRAVNLHRRGKISESLAEFEKVNQIADTRSEFHVVSRCHRAWILATAKDNSLKNLAVARSDAEAIRRETQDRYISWLPLLVLAACHAEEDSFNEAAKRANDALARASTDPIGRDDLKNNVLRTCRNLVDRFEADLPLSASDRALPYPTAAIGM